MSLYVRQTALTGHERSEVRDDNKNTRWVVQHEKNPLLFCVNVFDPQGNKVASIKQKLKFQSEFEITVNGALFATLHKKTTVMKPEYYLEGVDWGLDGDYYFQNFKALSRFGGVVMQQQMQWYTWGNTYIIDYSKPSEELYCLCIALAVDSADANSYRFRH